MLCAWGLLSVLVAQAKEPGPNELQLAWLDASGQVQMAVLGRGDAKVHAVSVNDRVPLGSLWKLVAYARLADSGPGEAPYTCRGQQRDEVYCCDPGQRIDRGTALWRSCGLYFEPERLGWSRLPVGSSLMALPAELASLRESSALRSDTRVPLAAWLRWLAHWSAAARQQAEDDLLGYWLQGPGRSQLGAVGSRLRLKTFTVERQEPGAGGQRWSGASGWTRDGMPIWMAARGSSKDVVPHWAPRVLAFLDGRAGAATQREIEPNVVSAAGAASDGGPCVRVRYFSRYPVRSIQPAPAAAGVLPAGMYEVRFVNGRTLPVESRRDLAVEPLAHPGAARQPAQTAAGRWQISGSFTLEDYVARVIDREGSGHPAAAAQALAVAARSYVLSRGVSEQGCLSIDDSSQTQRVAPRPASPAARAAAAHTADLVLRHGEGRYHFDQTRVGVLSWQASVQQAQAGQTFDAILASAYGGSTGQTTGRSTARVALASYTGRSGSDCEPLPVSERWLSARRSAWQRELSGEPGYTPPRGVQVCRLQQGRPHSSRAASRIFVSGSQSLEERLSLTHEYLHLAFSGHPRGIDEAFIERRARQLLGVE